MPMILRRLTANLRAQNWTAIGIEFVILVAGVFIGTQVSNWNQSRLEKRQTENLLAQLAPEIQNQLAFFESARTYYGITRNYAGQALAGWRGDPRVSDNQFVIAAYQASQAYGIGINAQNWNLAFGGDQMRDIDDPHIRRDLAIVLTADYDTVGFKAVQTPYRDQVRSVLPDSVQQLVRARCGDRLIYASGVAPLTVLAPTCPLQLDPAQAAAAAKALRAHPELANALNQHLSTVATYLENADGLEQQMRTLAQDLKSIS
jgi:hypothetical protein